MFTIWGLANMSNRRPWILGSFIVIFLGLIGLAILLQSELYLYAASALPVLIVTVLPDVRRNQYIRGEKARQAVQLNKQTNGEETLLIVSFQPGFVRWNSKKLFFFLNDIEQNPKPFEEAKDREAVSLSILAYDLSLHPRRSGWIGIDLAQLAQRTANLSYTTDEITRFVIRMSDLEETAMQMLSSTNKIPLSKGKSKSMSA
jgi:hypothetical protein